MSHKQTPSQTVGPYFAYGLTPEQYGYAMKSLDGAMLLRPDTEGEKVKIIGQVFDGNGDIINDAMIEIWQADAQGRYPHPADPHGSNSSFKGFGRFGTGTDPQNRFIFDTIKPGSAEPHVAPHINVIVFARGLPNHVFTRIYFSDETVANAADPVLTSVPEDRRATLIAQRSDTSDGGVYKFDIHMQGEAETVFFDV
jgi:protocatechuate 3,4-dioxygenase alpha subunit